MLKSKVPEGWIEVFMAKSLTLNMLEEHAQQRDKYGPHAASISKQLRDDLDLFLAAVGDNSDLMLPSVSRITTLQKTCDAFCALVPPMYTETARALSDALRTLNEVRQTFDADATTKKSVPRRQPAPSHDSDDDDEHGSLPPSPRAR